MTSDAREHSKQPGLFRYRFATRRPRPAIQIQCHHQIPTPKGKKLVAMTRTCSDESIQNTSFFFFFYSSDLYIYSREFVPVAIQHSIRRQLLCGYYDFRIYASASCALFSFCCVLTISFKAQFVLTVWAWSDSDTTVFLTYKSRCLVCSSLTKMSLSSPSNVQSAGGDERKEGQAKRDSCSEAFSVRKLSHDVENKALASLFFLEQAQRKANLSRFPTKPAI